MPERAHYIRCTHCGHLNPFKTEYLTLCESCGRKLLLNFPDWQKNHPGKTVIDFRKEVCVSDQEHSGHQAPPKSGSIISSRSFRLWLLALFCGLLLGTWLWYPGKDELFIRKYLPESVLTTEWIWHNTGIPPMVINLPEKPEKQQADVPAALTEFAEHAESFRYRPAASLTVTIDYYRFKPGIAPNPEPVAHAVMKQMVENNEIKFSSYDESPVMYLSARGLNLEGAFHEKGKLKQYRFVIYTFRNAAYVVKTVFRNTDSAAVKAAEKIMDSVEIDTEMKGV